LDLVHKEKFIIASPVYQAKKPRAPRVHTKRGNMLR